MVEPRRLIQLGSFWWHTQWLMLHTLSSVHDCFLPPKSPSFLFSLCIFCSLIMFPHLSSTSAPISHRSVFPSQSSHLLYQHPCTHTFLLPSSITLPLPVLLDSCCTFLCFLHTYSLSHLLKLFFPSHLSLCLCVFAFMYSPRWTGRWI